MQPSWIELRLASRAISEKNPELAEVNDDGPGIPAEELNLLFKPFSATSTRPTAGERSTGLGLSIAKRLTEAHNGHIGVSTQPGAGATFFINLPINN